MQSKKNTPNPPPPPPKKFLLLPPLISLFLLVLKTDPIYSWGEKSRRRGIWVAKLGGGRGPLMQFARKKNISFSLSSPSIGLLLRSKNCFSLDGLPSAKRPILFDDLGCLPLLAPSSNLVFLVGIRQKKVYFHFTLFYRVLWRPVWALKMPFFEK